MEGQEENKSEFEYPTKFNKYRRMMEKQSTQTHNGTTSPLKMETSEGPEYQKELHNENAASQSIRLDPTPAQQINFHHSPPKKIFISRASDLYCQDAPLNLSTSRTNQQQDRSDSERCGVDDDDDDDDDDVDKSNMESMIIEDHFKRSLGNLYKSQMRSNPEPHAPYGCFGNRVATSANSISYPVDNANNASSSNGKFSNNTSLSNHFNFTMSAIFSPVSLTSNPHNGFSTSPNHFSPHHFTNVLKANQIHDGHFHGNHFLGGHLHGGSFPSNVLFNGHARHQVEQSGKRPTASSSLHHSSSFNGVRSHKSSSPSTKSTNRHRYTPPDSYQPYSTDSKHRAEVILKSSADASSVSGCVDDHFSKSLGEVWKQVKASALSAELEELMPTSVDDHFAKALGDKWLKIQSDQLDAESPKKIASRNTNFFQSPSTFVVRS